MSKHHHFPKLSREKQILFIDGLQQRKLWWEENKLYNYKSFSQWGMFPTELLAWYDEIEEY